MRTPSIVCLGFYWEGTLSNLPSGFRLSWPFFFPSISPPHFFVILIHGVEGPSEPDRRSVFFECDNLTVWPFRFRIDFETESFRHMIEYPGRIHRSYQHRTVQYQRMLRYFIPWARFKPTIPVLPWGIQCPTLYHCKFSLMRSILIPSHANCFQFAFIFCVFIVTSCMFRLPGNYHHGHDLVKNNRLFTIFVYNFCLYSTVNYKIQHFLILKIIYLILKIILNFGIFFNWLCNSHLEP